MEYGLSNISLIIDGKELKLLDLFCPGFANPFPLADIMRLLLSLTILMCSVTGNSQGNRQKLFVAEFRIDTPRAGNYTYLVSYNFENGKLQSKDTILGAETFKEDRKGRFNRYVRFEFGRNFIYNNRYVVSGTGNVIDIKKKNS